MCELTKGQEILYEQKSFAKIKDVTSFQWNNYTKAFDEKALHKTSCTIINLNYLKKKE